jgi:hypothetical protein
MTTTQIMLCAIAIFSAGAFVGNLTADLEFGCTLAFTRVYAIIVFGVSVGILTVLHFCK